jgi:uncharacterized protein
MSQVFDTRLTILDDTFRADPTSRTLHGYAVVFNTLTEIGPGIWEEIAPEAVDRSLNNNDDIRALKDHKPDAVLGRRSKGTLRLQKDQRGLRVEIDVPKTQVGEDLLVSVQRGDVDGMSFSFFNQKYQFRTESGKRIARLVDCQLREVSPVSFPAYPQTTLALRSMQEWQDTLTPVEKPASDVLIAFNQRLRERR